MDKLNKTPSIEVLLAENKQLKQQNRLLHSIVENAPILISAKDVKGNILLANAHFNVLGPDSKEYINRNVFDFFPKEIAQQLWENDKKAQLSEVPIEVEERVHHKDGSLHSYHTTKFRLIDDDNALIGTCAVSFDITDLKKLELEAQHDHLTGLYNRRFLETTIENEISRAARDNQYCVFALFDLDCFKDVNDQLGHITGDEVLIAVAHTLDESLQRPGDFCYRLGGDEFVATFFVPCAVTAELMLDSLRKDVNNTIKRIIPNSKKPCQVSIGARIIKPSEKVEFRQLYAEADQALYKAKESGKNKYFFHLT